jgi:hypothetical protein
MLLFEGNKITVVQNLSSLQALTELNLRRNSIFKVHDLDKIPALQRVFLSHNQIASMFDIACVFDVKLLVELSLDGNPVCEINPAELRNRLISGIKGLKHLDLKRISDEERTAAESTCVNNSADPLLPGLSPDLKLSTEQANLDFLSTACQATITNSSSYVLPNKPAVAVSESYTKNAHASVGLAALARSGRITFSAQSFFDIEVIRCFSFQI